MRRLRILAVLALAACGDGTDGKGPTGKPDGGTLDLPGARAEPITREDQLVDGPVAAGKVGDFLLRNEKVRFVIEGPGVASDLYIPFGGAIVAADRVRAPGEPGETRFGEIFVSLNYRAPTADTVEILADGRDGNEAKIRVSGHPGVFPLIESLLADGSSAYAAETTIDYTLMPGADYLSMRVGVKNTGAATLNINANWLGFVMSRGLKNYVPGLGFDVGPNSIEEVKTLAASAGYFAVVGERISYSFLSPGEDFNPLPPFAGVMLGTYGNLVVPPGETRAYEMLVVVGPGDPAFHLKVHEEALGGQFTVADLAGVVRDSLGFAVQNARVHIEDTTKPRASGYVALARTGEDGAFHAVLRPGSYRLTAIADGSAPGAAQIVALGADGETDLALAVGGSGFLAFSALDAQGLPLPAKFSVEPAAGLPALPDTFGEFDGARGLWAQEFSLSGIATLKVPAGEVKVTVSRGFEYDIDQRTVTVTAGQITNITATLRRVVDTGGWISSDLHLHARFSADGWDMYPEKVRSFAAEGLEVPVNTEHEWIGDYGPTVAALGAGAWMHAIVGTEMTTVQTGHFNIFPLVPDLTKPNDGAIVWFGRSIPQVMKSIRDMPGRPLVQLNHPRAPTMAYLTTVGFSPELFDVSPGKRGQWCVQTVWCADFDLIEVMGADRLLEFEGGAGYASPVMADWAAFMNRGVPIVGTGASDSHRSQVKTVGYPRTYVRAGTDDPAALTDGAFFEGLRAGKAVISAGPFLTATFHGKDASSEVQKADAATDGNFVDLRIVLQAPPWMGPMSRLDVLQADPDAPYPHAVGKKYGTSVAATFDLSADAGTEVVRFDRTVRLRPGRDTWYLVRARGPRSLHPVSIGTPFAFTNPLWIDADRDGRWVPPIQ